MPTCLPEHSHWIGRLLEPQNYPGTFFFVQWQGDPTLEVSLIEPGFCQHRRDNRLMALASVVRRGGERKLFRREAIGIGGATGHKRNRLKRLGR